MVEVRAAVRKLLGEGVDEHQPLMEAGLDSLGLSFHFDRYIFFLSHLEQSLLSDRCCGAAYEPRGRLRAGPASDADL